MYLMHGKDDVLTKAQVPIWDVPIGREPVKMEGSELEGEDEITGTLPFLSFVYVEVRK